jgi:hypothetical protein
MHHEVDLGPHGRLEAPFIVGQEVISTSPSADPWPQREIEAHVGVGNQQDANRSLFRMGSVVQAHSRLNRPYLGNGALLILQESLDFGQGHFVGDNGQGVLVGK